MMPFLKSAAMAVLLDSTMGEMTHITSFPSVSTPSKGLNMHQCPLRVLRDSIRAECTTDVNEKCSISYTPEFPFFARQPFSSGMMSFPPPSIGMGSFDDLESIIDEMFSSTLQIFDQAMMANNRQVAEERAVKAFDAKLPTFVDEIVSSASSASSSSSDGGEIEKGPPQDEDLSTLVEDIMDITRNIQIDTHRRRLSEGDPHVEMKDRLARRLTEYVSRTDVFQLPGGGVLRVVSVSPVEETPRLGLGCSVDECIYSQYKNGDLSSGCATAVSSFVNFVNQRRFGFQQQAFNSEPTATDTQAPAEDVTLLQTLSGMHQQFVHDNSLAYASILSSLLLICLCLLAMQNIWLCIFCAAITVVAIFFGPVYMLAALALMVIIDQFYPDEDDGDENEEGGEADVFDYVKMEEDNGKVCADVQMEKPGQHRVFVGVPVQVV